MFQRMIFSLFSPPARMKYLAALLFVCVLAVAQSVVDTNGKRVNLSDSVNIGLADEEVCGTAQMNFYWGGLVVEQSSQPRLAEIYFYYNGTFFDTTYNYIGNWLSFGENGDDVMVFEYPAATYVSPTNNGRGSMISHSVCGHWDFSNFKWYCPNACDNNSI